MTSKTTKWKEKKEEQWNNKKKIHNKRLYYKFIMNEMINIKRKEEQKKRQKM